MSIDGRAGWTINRPLLLAGRRPDPGRPGEVGLSESLARRWTVEPGDTIRLRALTPPQLLPALAGERVLPAAGSTAPQHADTTLGHQEGQTRRPN